MKTIKIISHWLLVTKNPFAVFPAPYPSSGLEPLDGFVASDISHRDAFGRSSIFGLPSPVTCLPSLFTVHPSSHFRLPSSNLFLTHES